MAFRHGKDTVVYFGNTEYSSYINSVDFSRSADVAETTVFGKNNKTYIVGVKDGVATINGFWDATMDSQLSSMLGSASNTLLVIGTGGISATDGCSFGNIKSTSYGESSPVGDVVAFSVDMQSDNGLYNGSVLENATYTVTASGTARDNTISSTNGGAGFLIVTSASGTTPTADIKITHSADDVTYADLVTFTQATSATSEIKQVAKGTTVNRYLKVEATIGGTSPSFSAIIGFGRNN